jgi:NADPH2:quinone reductase
MKAISVRGFGEPEVLKLEDRPDPTPGAGEVVVRLQAIGINPVEVYIRMGIYGQREFPYTPGSDGGGVVEAVGPGVTRFTVGQRVYTSGSKTGTYAQKALCDVAQVHPLPDNVSFAQGAAIGVPYATAHRALFGRARARAGDTVLVHGASGGVGVAAVQLAHHAGMTVIGTAGSEAGRRLVLEQGADHVLDHTRPGYLDEAMRLTDGRGVEVILEMLANVNLDRDLAVLARDGRVIVIGSRGNIEIDPRQTMKRDADIRGMTLFNVPPDELARIHASLFAGLRNGMLRPIIQTELPLADAARAHELVMQNNSHGKIVLVP